MKLGGIVLLDAFWEVSVEN